MRNPNLIRVGPKGRFVLPVHVRRALGVAEGDELVAIVRDREVLLVTRDDARSLVRDAFVDGPNPVDELLAERRAEAEADLGRQPRQRSA